MNELLANPVIQTAVVLLLVKVITALVDWLKAKFPTQAASVESNWCYLQPVVEAAMKTAQAAMGKSSFSGKAVGDIIAKSLAEFADQYRKLEAKEASDAELAAARNEITAAVERVTGG